MRSSMHADRNEGQAPCVHSWTREAKAMECRGNIENEAEMADEATRGLRKHADAFDHRMQYHSQVDGRVLPKAQSIGQRARRRGGYSTGSKNSIGSRPDGTEGTSRLERRTSAGKSPLRSAAKTVASSHQIEVVEHNGSSTTCACHWRGDLHARNGARRGLAAAMLRIGSSQWPLIETGEIGPTDLHNSRRGGRRTLATARFH